MWYYLNYLLAENAYNKFDKNEVEELARDASHLDLIKNAVLLER